MNIKRPKPKPVVDKIKQDFDDTILTCFSSFHCSYLFKYERKKDIWRPTRNVKIVKSDLSHNIMDMAQMIGFVNVNAKNKTLIIVMEKFIKAIKPFRSIKQETESTTVLVC